MSVYTSLEMATNHWNYIIQDHKKDKDESLTAVINETMKTYQSMSDDERTIFNNKIVLCKTYNYTQVLENIIEPNTILYRFRKEISPSKENQKAPLLASIVQATLVTRWCKDLQLDGSYQPLQRHMDERPGENCIIM